MCYRCITELMGVQAPPELLGIHTNMANVIPLDIDKLALLARPRLRISRPTRSWLTSG